MVARRSPGRTPAVVKTRAASRAGNYLADDEVQFVPTGCTVLDCVLGGGWPLGRIANIVGDKAVGKTLLAIEACANFSRFWPQGHVWYREVEAAFDVRYAEQLGLPRGRVDFGPDGVDSSWETVEDIFEDLEACIGVAEKSGRPGLYVVDSLDALSSRAELKRKIDQGSYGTDKASVMSELFRRLKKRIKRANIALLIVSQIRDKIGIVFGEKHTRTGGRALDFYASQILWLHHKKTLTATVKGVERAVGVRIRAKCKKNKLGPGFRECEFVLRFGYGIDDLEASATWLGEMGMLDRVGVSKKDGIAAFLRQLSRLPQEDARTQRGAIAKVVTAAWEEVEARFTPQQRKYE